MKTTITATTYRQEMSFSYLVAAALLTLAVLLMAGCGGGGGSEGSAPAGVNVPTGPAPQAQVNSFSITGDSYGVENSTYLSSTKSALGIVLRGAIASSMTDPDFKTISRIDIASGAAITPQVVYSLGSAGGASAFPGNVYLFNGHQSTLLRTVGGSITFSRYGGNAGDRISGSYSAVVEDGNDPARPSYIVAASFDFVTDSYGAVTPAPVSRALSAQPSYQAFCASCHAMGSYDQAAAGASDLSLKGGRLNGIFTPDQQGHQGITLSASEIGNLKVLLNTN